MGRAIGPDDPRIKERRENERIDLYNQNQVDYFSM